MKSKIFLFLVVLFLTVVETQAQLDCNEPFNPYYICRSGFEQADYLFYGEIISIERINNTFVNSTGAWFKAVVKVGRNFKKKLPRKITLYLGARLTCQQPAAKNRYLFQAVDGNLNQRKVYFTELMSRPMTDYSGNAVKKVFANIESALSNRKNNFVAGAVFEQLLKVSEVSLKSEDADRLSVDLRIRRPLANIPIKAVSEKDGKIYRSASKTDGTFRIDNIPNGTYKIELNLPPDTEQAEPLSYRADDSPCSRNWYIYVQQKPGRQSSRISKNQKPAH